jgi:hypothetical protein
MARTKQTARMAVVRQAPKNKGVKKARKSTLGISGLGSGKVGCKRTAVGLAPDSDSESE